LNLRVGQGALRSFRPGVQWGFVSLPATLHLMHCNVGRPHQTLATAAGGSARNRGALPLGRTAAIRAIDWDRDQVEANMGIALSGLNAAS
jgi:hypothetical protein